MLIYFIKIRVFANPPLNQLFKSSIRQGILFSVIIVVLLMLQGMKVLDIWVGVPLVIVIVLIELFLRSKRK